MTLIIGDVPMIKYIHGAEKPFTLERQQMIGCGTHKASCLTNALEQISVKLSTSAVQAFPGGAFDHKLDI